MSDIVLVALNTRHTHSSLSLACLQAYWDATPGHPPLRRLDFDLNRGTDALVQELICLRPKVVAFSVYIWSLFPALAISGALKAALPETRIVFGGPEVSFGAEDLLQKNPWVDLILRGEGEITFQEAMERLLNDRGCDGVLGSTWRKGRDVHEEPERPVEADLDRFPSPFTAGLYGRGNGFTYYEASRGCPYRCTYCLSSVLGPLRQFSLERVFADLDWFYQSDYTQVRFADRTFNQDKKRAMAILRHILERNARKVKFHFELKADLISDEIIDLLGQAPDDLFHLEIGVQTTHSPALDAVGRRADLDLLAERILAVRTRTRCHVHLDLLAGLPGEGMIEFRKTLNDAHYWKPSTIQVGLVKVLKGTGLEKNVLAGDLFPAPFPPYAVQRTKWLPPEEIVRILDIGRLVEGIGNPGRFAKSLKYAAQSCFQGDWAMMYEAMAIFWRGRQSLFYGFGPETVMRGLADFFDQQEIVKAVKVALQAMCLHEYRLSQKVPSGAAGPVPKMNSVPGKIVYRRIPGLKVFWYPTDPSSLFDGEAALSPTLFPAPVVYTYQTDLSLPPETGVLELPLLERFVLACAEQIEGAADLAILWLATGREACTEEEFAGGLDRMLEKGLLYTGTKPPTRKSARKEPPEDRRS